MAFSVFIVSGIRLVLIVARNLTTTQKDTKRSEMRQVGETFEIFILLNLEKSLRPYLNQV